MHWVSLEHALPSAVFGAQTLPLQYAVDAQSVSPEQEVLHAVDDAHAKLPGQGAAERQLPLVLHTERELPLQPLPQLAPALG